MLEAIRKRSASFVVKLLLGLLILSFGIWGVGDTIRSGIGGPSVAKVGSIEIRPEDLSRDFQREMNRLRSVFGPSFDQEQARAMGLVDSVLDSMISRALFDLAAKDLGVAISDEVVLERIRGNRAFFNMLGTFDRARFQQVIQNNGWSEGAYIAQMRGDLGRAIYVNSVEKGVAAPRSLVEAVYTYRQEKRVADTILVADGDMTAIPEPDDAALVKFHKEHTDRFTAPEYRALTVVSLKAEDLVKEVAVSDEMIAQVFEERRDEFNKPEQRRVIQMVLPDEATVRRAHQALVGGGSFAEVAKEIAGVDEATLDLGLVQREHLLPELADAVFAVAKGAFSEPVESPLGWHILKVTGIEAAREQTVDEVREQLIQIAAHEKATEDLFELANRLEDQLGGGATLEEGASALNLKLVKIPAIDRRGRDAAGHLVNDLPEGDQFLSTAFETAENNDSSLTEAGTDGYFVLRVDGVTAPALRPLDTVRKEVAANWKAGKQAEAAEKTAKGLIEKVKAGTELSAVAAGAGLKVTTPPPFLRGSNEDSQGLPQTLVSKLFDVRLGEAVMARGVNGYYVARLVEIRPADLAADKQGIDNLADEITNSLRNDLVIQLSAALRDRFPVSVNRQAVDQLF
jgi:peptidyl-prolyl cis-trans isomerase D